MSDFLKPNNPFQKAEKPKTIPLPTTKKGVRSTYKKPSKVVDAPLEEEKKVATSQEIASAQKETSASNIQSTQSSTVSETKTSSSLTSSSFNTSYNESIGQKSSISDLRARIMEKEKSALLSKIPASNSSQVPSSSLRSSASSSSTISSASSASSSNTSSTRLLTTQKLNVVNSHSLISSTKTETKTNSFLDRSKESAITNNSTPSFKVPEPAPSVGTKSVLNSDITDAEFVKLRDFLYEQSGIFVTETRKYLFKNRLLGRLNELNLQSYDEYYTYLKTKDASKKELNKFYEQMTTNETSFFRNVPQLNTVNEHVFKKYVEANKKEKKLNIFSAGCSSGEEPYTLAIMLLELLKAEKSQWKIKITAGDLSPAMLVAAKEGLYTDYSLRSTPKEYVKKYFKEKDGLFEVNEEVKKMVSFTQINLNDRAMVKKLVPQSDIVFCRNVIIYFDEEVKRNVIGGFYDNLIMGGALIIGHSETLNNITKQFEVSYLPNTQVYTKI